MGEGLLRLWHTLRWLRPVQFYGRAWFRLARPRVDTRPSPALRQSAAPWRACARPVSLLSPIRLRLLGDERDLQSAEDWDRADWPRLWRYNAHYFDDLVADGAGARNAWHRGLIQRWIAENPPAVGSGWEPYPTSLRIVNWIKWALAGNTLTDEATHSLAVQVRWLRKRLEMHLLGNHLWANLKALVFAGAFFDGHEADAWWRAGLDRLQRELAEQVLPDGGHFERSPMYHAIVLEDLLDLIQLARTYPRRFAPPDVARWRAAAAAMLRWLRVMTHPDGDIAFFNDAALGIAPAFAALSDYARVLDIEQDGAPLADVEALPESGYVRLQAGGAVLIADVGEIGPDYLPGHAHADTLSFELSLDGARVLVNSGTSTYEAGPERLRQRGTEAHNTVVVDGADSSEVWSSFRVARRARPSGVRWGREGDFVWLEAGHDGYRRLAPPAVHHRRWELRANSLDVMDRVEGGAGRAEARFHFHPQASTEPQRMRWFVQGGDADLAPSTWHPRFGSIEPSRVLMVALRENLLMTRFLWS